MLIVANQSASQYTSTLSSRKSFNSIVSKVSFQQRWNVFAPDPPSSESWPVAEALTESGVTVDLWKYYWTNGQHYQVSLEKPSLLMNTFVNSTWQKYIEHVLTAETNPNTDQFLQYLCRNWNADYSDTVSHVSLYSLTEITNISEGPDTNKGEYPQKPISTNFNCS